MRTNMRSIVIAFLFWHCCPDRMVSLACTRRESTTSTAGTTRCGVMSTIAHVNRKDSAFVTDRNSVAKTFRSDIDVRQRPAVDTSDLITSKNPCAVKEPRKTAGRNCPQSTEADHVDNRARSIDSPSPRSCIPPRDFDSTLRNTCVAIEAEQRWNKQANAYELAETDPNAKQYEAARDKLADDAEDRNDDADPVDPWKLHGAVRGDADEIGSVYADEELLCRRHREISDEIAHPDEMSWDEDQDPFSSSEVILENQPWNKVPPVDPVEMHKSGHGSRPIQNLEDPAVDSCGKTSLPEEIEAEPKDSIAASSSDNTPSPTYDCSEAMIRMESQQPGASTEDSETAYMIEVPIAPAEFPPSSMSEAPETNDAPRAMVSFGETLEALVSDESADAFAEIAISDTHSKLTSESSQDLGLENSPISANEFPEVADFHEATGKEGEASETVVLEQNAEVESVSCACPNRPVDPNKPTASGEKTSERQTAVDKSQLEDDSLRVSLPEKQAILPHDPAKAVSPEKPGTPSKKSKVELNALAVESPKALAPAKSMNCPAVFDTASPSDAKTKIESESESEPAAETETIGGNSSGELKSVGGTSTTLLPATGDSKTQEIAN